MGRLCPQISPHRYTPVSSLACQLKDVCLFLFYSSSEGLSTNLVWRHTEDWNPVLPSCNLTFYYNTPAVSLHFVPQKPLKHIQNKDLGCWFQDLKQARVYELPDHFKSFILSLKAPKMFEEQPPALFYSAVVARIDASCPLEGAAASNILAAEILALLWLSCQGPQCCEKKSYLMSKKS